MPELRRLQEAIPGRPEAGCEEEEALPHRPAAREAEVPQQHGTKAASRPAESVRGLARVDSQPAEQEASAQGADSKRGRGPLQWFVLHVQDAIQTGRGAAAGTGPIAECYCAAAASVLREECFLLEPLEFSSAYNLKISSALVNFIPWENQPKFFIHVLII